MAHRVLVLIYSASLVPPPRPASDCTPCTNEHTALLAFRRERMRADRSGNGDGDDDDDDDDDGMRKEEQSLSTKVYTYDVLGGESCRPVWRRLQQMPQASAGLGGRSAYEDNFV